MIHVFLKNKIISTDAIVPTLLEARRQGYSGRIVFYVQSRETLEVLRRNSVLWEGLSTLGTVVLAVAPDRTVLGYVRHRVWAVFWLAGLATALMMGRARIVHFGQLYNSNVYRFLLHIRPRSVLLVEGAFAGFSKVQEDFARLKADRGEGFDLARAPVIAVFESHSNLADRARSFGTEPIVIGTPHLLIGWTDFIDRLAEVEFKDGPEEIIVFILGYFGQLEFMRSDSAVTELFEETVDVLERESGGRPVYVKPHSISDMAIVNRVVDGRAGIRLTNIHPAVLAMRAKFTIANYYSTALSTVFALGGTTVEYTDYSDAALELSGGGSTRADSITHFLQRDKAGLASLVRKLVSAPRRETDRASHAAPNALVSWLSD